MCCIKLAGEGDNNTNGYCYNHNEQGKKDPTTS